MSRNVIQIMPFMHIDDVTRAVDFLSSSGKLSLPLSPKRATRTTRVAGASAFLLPTMRKMARFSACDHTR